LLFFFTPGGYVWLSHRAEGRRAGTVAAIRPFTPTGHSDPAGAGSQGREAMVVAPYPTSGGSPVCGVAGAVLVAFHPGESTDQQQINAVMTKAMLAHVKKGTPIPVTLSTGPRILQIFDAEVIYDSNHVPTTYVGVIVFDPKTGARDPKYVGGAVTTIEGLAYYIPPPMD
jgi:hypothetical protein